MLFAQRLAADPLPRLYHCDYYFYSYYTHSVQTTWKDRGEDRKGVTEGIAWFVRVLSECTYNTIVSNTL